MSKSSQSPRRRTLTRSLGVGGSQALPWKHASPTSPKVGLFLFLFPMPLKRRKHENPMNRIDERYQILGELGRGGMGVVYLGHDEVLDRDVAIKLVSDPQLDEKGRARVLREARLAGQLNHPNIVAVHDAGETGGNPYIVMEHIEGKSVFQCPPRNLEEIKQIALQICDALDHAHANGIVHRDLKPENIVLAEDGRVKLTDFGLAMKMSSRISSEGSVVGTVYYLAPELLQGKNIDQRADLYALGVLLYEWCTGQLPFVADDPMAVITQHLFAPAPHPRIKAPHLPEAACQLILQLLNKSPDDRPSSAREIMEVLQSPEFITGQIDPSSQTAVLQWIGRGRMTGRERELQQARGVWSKVVGGKSHTLLIRGEAGIGKTRLVNELIALAQVTGGRLLQGLNDSQAGRPFGPFKQILRSSLEWDASLLTSLPEQVVADVLALVPEYESVFAGTIDRPSMTTDYEQQRLFESLAIFISTLSQASPLMIVIEDAQWADSATLHLFHYLGQQIRERPILFVLTFRDVELPETQVLQEVLLDLDREKLATLLTLNRLTKSETEAMLIANLGAGLSPALVDEINEVTEGNPFFIEEVCKGLLEKGRLVFEKDLLQATGPSSLEIPANVRVAIQSRIRDMPAPTQSLLEAAAVRGRHFELEVIRNIERLDEFDLADALRSAVRAHIIEELPTVNGRQFSFTHALIPSAIVESIPSKRWKSIHSKIAPILEATDSDEFEALAFHCQAAGEVEKAIRYFIMAADRAYALYACREAIQSYSEALTLQKDRKENEAAARTLLKLGLVYSADFQFDMAQRAYEEAFDLWDLVLRSEDEAKAAEPSETLRFAIDEPFTLDPGRADDDLSSFLIGQLFEGLLEIDEASGIVPALASRWDVSQDGRRYTFYLRQGRQWSDGSPVTAGDFEYAWKRNISLIPQSLAAPLLNVIENADASVEDGQDGSRLGVRAVDDLTLEVRLKAPAAFFPQLLTHAATFPLPRWVVEGKRQPWTDTENLVTNGPFRLEAWAPGDKIILTRNPYYSGLFPGNVERVEAPTIAQYPKTLEAFDRGSLDGVSLINADPGTINHLKATYRREFRITPMLSTLYIAFRADHPPFDDARVRRAFIHSIDRSALLSQSGSAHLEPAQGGFLPPGMPGHSPSIGLSVDVQAAQRLLEEAGYPRGDGLPQISFLYSGDPAGNPIASNLHQQWRDVLGVAVKVQGLAWSEFMNRQESDPPHIAINGWQADYHDPDSMLRILFHSREGVNDIRWSNHRFDSLIEEAAQIADRKIRIELYQEADRILVASEAIVMPLTYGLGRQLTKPYVRIPRSPPSLLRLKHAVVEKTME